MRWLEYALIKKATKVNRCILNNNTIPQEPSLSDADKATINVFLKEILRMLLLVGLHVFEKLKVVTHHPLLTVVERLLLHQSV